MKTDPHLSQRPQSHTHLHAGSASACAAPSASGTLYTCTMHPETVREAPQACPQCGMTLIPMHQILAHAAMALKSLSAATTALRIYRF